MRSNPGFLPHPMRSVCLIEDGRRGNGNRGNTVNPVHCEEVKILVRGGGKLSNLDLTGGFRLVGRPASE